MAAVACCCLIAAPCLGFKPAPPCGTHHLAGQVAIQPVSQGRRNEQPRDRRSCMRGRPEPGCIGWRSHAAGAAEGARGKHEAKGTSSTGLGLQKLCAAAGCAAVGERPCRASRCLLLCLTRDDGRHCCHPDQRQNRRDGENLDAGRSERQTGAPEPGPWGLTVSWLLGEMARNFPLTVLVALLPAAPLSAAAQQRATGRRPGPGVLPLLCCVPPLPSLLLHT
jgi:hypothetical protein